MRLKRFRAAGVHGYLSVDVKFKGGLTFLTGINGSGKTTVLNGIAALITPDFHTLAQLRYEFLELELENADQSHIIRSTFDGSNCTLSILDEPEAFTFRRYSPDPDLASYKQSDIEREHYRNLSDANSEHPVLRLIASLPNPMYLGLDRRSRLDAEERRLRLSAYRYTRAGRQPFLPSTPGSLQDAAALAATKFRDALISAARVGDNLRKQLTLSLLQVAPQNFESLSLPTSAELNEIQRIERNLGSLSTILRVDQAEVEERVLPFLRELDSAAKKIPKGSSVTKLVNDHRQQDVLQALISWSSNRGQLKRIRSLSSIAENYNSQRVEALRPIEDYKKVVNAFLNESGKSIGLSEDGYVYVTIPGSNDERDISSLSSGEAQIFVIMTHLSFSPEAQEANVFIIDEPELSLHVAWQELFVESVLNANPNIQYVMATHSPSIILQKLRNCVDLSPRIAK